MAKQSSENRILAAATAEFSQYGYDGARMDRIAKRARINKAMIYYHFKSKESLYENIFADYAGKMFSFVNEITLTDEDPLNQFYTLIENFIKFVNTVDLDVVRFMLREVSTGGKYMRKIILPNVLRPILKIVLELFETAKREKKIKDVNPYFSFLHLVGGILFFNSIRIVLDGTDLYRQIYRGDYFEDFKNNMLMIISRGIEKSQEGKQDE